MNQTSETQQTVTHNGKEYTLTQNAYISTDPRNLDGAAVYLADATDADGKEYEIVWKVIDQHADDESNSCDWQHPHKVIAL